MTRDDAGTATRRVLVAMDASSDGLAAVAMAVRLAAELGAEVQGLFVENVNLLRLAALSVAREVALCAPVSRPLDPASMERVLRAQAECVRRDLAQRAERVRVTWSFEVARGHVVHCTLAIAQDADLLVLGKENSAPRLPPPSRQRAVTGPLLVVYDGSPGSRRALETGAQLAHAADDEIIVAVIPSGAHAWDELSQDAADALETAEVEGAIAALRQPDAAELVREARRRQVQLVLMGRHCPLLDPAALELLVEELECPLALVQ